MIGTLVGDHYTLDRKIGEGSFGEVYLGSHVHTGAQVAVKLEPVSARQPQLSYESKLLRFLQGSPGLPEVYWAGVTGEHTAMVTSLHGASLASLFDACQRRCTLKTVLMLADQMLARVEYVHSKHYVHRDIKPENFLVGLNENKHLLYIIDFGLAKKYRDTRTHKHALLKEGKALTGNPRYASLNTHLGLEQSRRDDLEAVGYVLLYLLRGSLPWQGLHVLEAYDKGRYEQA